MAAYVGEQVTVRFNPRDVSEIRVYFNDTFLCRAIAPEVAADSISLQQQQSARTRRRHDLKQQLRARLSLADALPTDSRYLPPEPTDVNPAPPGDTPPRHGLRLYAND